MNGLGPKFSRSTRPATHRATRIRRGASWLAAAAAFTLLAGPARSVAATDSLATPITSEIAEAAWPVRLQVEIVAIGGRDAVRNTARAADAAPTDAAPTDVAPKDVPSEGEGPLPKRTVVVPDGHRLEFNSSVRSDRGRLDFELRVVPRVHPRGAVELEWDLLVSEAKFRPMGVGGYVAHRLQLAGEPELGPSLLSIARSDIVSTTGETFLEEVQVGGRTFEIRILAQSLRG